MTTSRTIVLSAVLALALPFAALAADGWGSSYSFGPSTSRIIYAKTTLVPGRLPPITSTFAVENANAPQFERQRGRAQRDAEGYAAPPRAT